MHSLPHSTHLHMGSLFGSLYAQQMPAAVDELLRAMGLSAVADRALGDPKVIPSLNRALIVVGCGEFVHSYVKLYLFIQPSRHFF